MKKRVLVTHKMPLEGYKEIMQHCEVTLPQGECFTREEVLDVIHKYDALLSIFTFKVDKTLIDKGSHLQIVSNFGVGFDNIDVAYCTSKGIQVTNTPDPVTEPTADQALGLMLAVARNISLNDRLLRQPGKVEWGLLERLGVSLFGKTLGIIGMGRIGKALARRASACGMKIIYNNRRQLPAEEEALYGANYASIDELFSSSHFISLNAPYTTETHHIINGTAFEKMRPDAILINTARGPMVNEKDLVEALKQKKIRGAGLDVFEYGETILPELFEMENVVINPHTGTQTIDARNEMTMLAARNIINFFEGKGTLCKVNKL